jgi:hypothetical protein
VIRLCFACVVKSSPRLESPSDVESMDGERFGTLVSIEISTEMDSCTSLMLGGLGGRLTLIIVDCRGRT